MNLKRKLIFVIFFNFKLFGQTKINSVLSQYTETLDQFSETIKTNGSFKETVFLVESLFWGNYKLIDYSYYIDECVNFLKGNKERIILLRNKQNDSLNYILNFSIFTFMSKKLSIKLGSLQAYTMPYIYNFDDPKGNKDWTNTFVTKLFTRHKGNCRSLTYFYKILADELGAKCWLALAPNHIYIRNYSQQIGWYNTELTSGTFPTDAWIAATGYVSTDAIRSGVYMDTLSNQQAIGLCILDLAQGYIKQTHNYTDSFVLRCCNLVLQYHTVNPEALLTKAEALKQMYLQQNANNNPNAQAIYEEMEQTYITLIKLGYREMPYKAYQKWLKTVRQNKEKFLNKKVKAVSKQNSF
jgi:hypothetical protein